jgi:hypothetical protein
VALWSQKKKNIQNNFFDLTTLCVSKKSGEFVLKKDATGQTVNKHVIIRFVFLENAFSEQVIFRYWSHSKQQ